MKVNNITPILIRKYPDRYENMPYNKEDFQSVINEVNLSDILDYIISAIEDKWAPNCYWSINSKEDKMFIGQLEWIIYSYLVHNKLLIIEDQYYSYNQSRIEKYKDRYSYHNTLERDLFIPIIKRMVNERYLTDVSSDTNDIDRYYKLGPIYWRNNNLNTLIW